MEPGPHEHPSCIFALPLSRESTSGSRWTQPAELRSVVPGSGNKHLFSIPCTKLLKLLRIISLIVLAASRPAFAQSPGVFSEGLIDWEMGEKVGFISPTGKVVIPAQWDVIMPFSEGLAAVGNLSEFEGKTHPGDVPVKKWGYIDKSGKNCGRIDMG
ncbi:MAG: hypothetical protein JWM59_986 [Verrucomicrobiales bacterium]|nr:hypothetical protein [Verrucomicrobiales bacterium]